MATGTGMRVDVQARAAALIRKNFGSISDLPESVCLVVWVTAYRSCEVAMNFESSGPNAIVKDLLAGTGRVGFTFEQSILRMELLRDLVPVIRGAKSGADRLRDAQLLVDILKWNIMDAGNLSRFRRFVARRLAKADDLYRVPVPSDLL